MTERKTERAKQLLVRYIRDRQLKNGDKLPPQNELRQIFRYGATTISSAINALKHDGVLDVRDKVGVFVLNPEAGGHAGRVIGITMVHGENNFYYSCLLASLQMHLVENGCMVRLFRCLRRETSERILFETDDFPGLRRSIENSEIQGLIHLNDLSRNALEFIGSKKLPLIFVGSPGGIAENGVFFDYGRIVEEACGMLKKRQARHPVLICPASVRQEVEEIFFGNFGRTASVFSGSRLGDDRDIVRKILAMHESERPDWLICLDDFAGLALTSALARRLGPDKMPGAFIMYDRASRMDYPLSKLICCDNDLHKFAAIGVKLLMKTMMSGGQSTGAVFYFPEITDLSGDLSIQQEG
ncbi:MAG: GntR family transcriptional regulator [Lentisphaeria bacterium]|nr:GntR family transcriptional regulator [Lentisphaeria bacterium]